MRRYVLANQQKNICDICNKSFDMININEIKLDGQDKIVCDQCLKKFLCCQQCGQYYKNKYDLQEIGGQYFCQICAEDYCECCQCDKLLKKQSAIEFYGESYCEDCFYEKYAFCFSCGDYVPTNEINLTYDDSKNKIWVCNGCRYKYIQTCYDCGKQININYDYYAYYDGDRIICDDCLNNAYAYCARCQQLFNIQNQLFQFNGQYYCNDCKPDYQIDPQSGDDNQQIYDYDTKLKLKFKKKLKEQQTNEYIGVQLQIVARQPHGLKYFIKQAKKNKKIIFKRDGSIGSGGIEINTQPATYQYHLSGMGWQRIFNLMNMYQVNDTTNCGIHFHISKSNFTSDQLKVLDYFVNKSTDLLGNIGGRDYKNSEYARAITDKTSWGENFLSRYQAVNFKNQDTVQLRFPKSTSNYNQFKKLLRMVHNICRFSKMFTFEQIKQLDQTQLSQLWFQLLKLVD